MSAHDDRGYDELTEREREVITLMARGLTNGQIAERLDIAFETAKWHVAHIISKTGAATREEAVANWRAWSRPGARGSRWVRGLAPLPWITGATFAVIAAVAGLVALAALLPAGNDSQPSRPPRTVRYLQFESNSPSRDEAILPFDEAIQRQREAIGDAPSEDGAFLREFGLSPLAVVVRTLPVAGVEGITEWSVWYGDGDSEETSPLYVGIVRAAQVGRLAAECNPEPPRTVAGWEQATTPSGRFDVVYRTLDGGDQTVYVGPSCFGTTLRVRGLTQADALAILETVLAQE